MITIRDQENETSHRLGENTESHVSGRRLLSKYATLGAAWQFLTTLNIPLAYNLATTLGICQKELKPVTQKPCIQMFTTALFIVPS